MNDLATPNSTPSADEGSVAPEHADHPEPVVEEVEVEIERSVRFGRIMIVGAIIGGILAVMITLMFPVVPEAMYEMRQIAGFMLVFGAAIGLALGALLALVLNLFAKRKHGHGVALHTDVQ